MKDLELMGDALEEVTEAQVFEAMADESELGDADIEAWATWWLSKEKRINETTNRRNREGPPFSLLHRKTLLLRISRWW
jgi:hypothetical protein